MVVWRAGFDATGIKEQVGYMELQKPTSRSSRALNWFVTVTVMGIWAAVSLKKWEVAPLDYSFVLLIFSCLLGRGFIEFVQAVGPNFLKKD